MKTLNEFQIALVYYSGLAISLLLGILGVAYLRPMEAIKRIFMKSGSVVSYNFITTILITGLLGAMSVSFKDCHGDYYTSVNTTVEKGIHQISTASLCLSIILAAWFLIFITMQVSKGLKTGVSRVFTLLSVISVLICVAGFYFVLFLNL